MDNGDRRPGDIPIIEPRRRAEPEERPAQPLPPEIELPIRVGFCIDAVHGILVMAGIFSLLAWLIPENRGCTTIVLGLGALWAAAVIGLLAKILAAVQKPRR